MQVLMSQLHNATVASVKFPGVYVCAYEKMHFLEMNEYHGNDDTATGMNKHRMLQIHRV